MKKSLKENTIIALGDSITYGYLDVEYAWPNLVSKELGVEIINAGVNGETLNQMRARLDYSVISYKPDLVILLGGTNDVLMGSSLADLSSDTSRIIDELSKNNIPVVVGLPIPIDDANFEHVMAQYRTWLNENMKYTISFHEDFFKNGKLDRTLLVDGVHPSPGGNLKMSKIAAEKIREILE